MMTWQELLTTHRAVERQLWSYMKFATTMISTAGFSLFGPANRVKRERLAGVKAPAAGMHGNGSLYKLIAAGDTELNGGSIDAWRQDTEHGLFHGLMTGFAAMMDWYNGVMPVTDNWLPNRVITESQKLFVSCLLHDFCRCGEDPHEHDGRLASRFSLLEPVTYKHSNPSGDDEQSSLVRGDRIELMRFSDHASWVRPGTFDFLKPGRRTQLEVFYRHIRPALEMMWRYRDVPWIRHGLECGPAVGSADRFLTWAKVSKNVWPVPGTYWRPHESKRHGHQGYAVEISMLPVHGTFLTQFHRWQPCGISPLPVARQHDCQLITINRDHVAATRPYDMKSWVIITGDKTQTLPKHVRELRKIYRRVGGVVDYRLANMAILTMDNMVMWLRSLRQYQNCVPGLPGPVSNSVF